MGKTYEHLLKKYVCKEAFRHLEIYDGRSHLCCPSWIETPVKHEIDNDGNENYNVWNNKLAVDIRKSILDGEYKYCNSSTCPHLSTLLNTGKPTGWMVEKSKLPYTDHDGYIIPDSGYMNSTPATINFTFDLSCNLRCPSCRAHTIMAKPDQIVEIDKKLEFINEKYSKDVRKIAITGSGDPFASKSFRRFLKNFNPKLYPNLKDINLTTNGILFNRKQWDMIKPAQPFVKTVEISIDAASKDVYENKVRLGGNWNTLLENLNFISTLDSIEFLRFSFVVQNDNFTQMYDFANLIYTICKHRIEKQNIFQQTSVYFSKIADWGHLGPSKFEEKAVWKESHTNYNSFVKEIQNLYKFKDKIYIQSNFTDLLV